LRKTYQLDIFNPSEEKAEMVINRKKSVLHRSLPNRVVSLFSPQAISEKHHRALLIQFILFELFASYKASQLQEDWETILSPHPRHFPYDWSAVTGYFNKAHEHSLLLTESFPDHAQHVVTFQRTFSKHLTFLAKKKKISLFLFTTALQKIYSKLEPLIEICRENENLLHFMLKNRETIDGFVGEGHLRSFLVKIHPQGLQLLGEKVCDQYHQRGFFSQIAEFKILLTELTHA
jgi:hypothetical protein